MGNATDDRPSLRATVICAGGENCGTRFDYQGIQTCAAANGIAGGPSACAYGCLGLGDCTRACMTAKNAPAAQPAPLSARAMSSR